MTTTNKIFVYALTAVRWACTGVILLTCVGWIMRFVPHLRSFLNADIVVYYDSVVNQFVKSLIPTDFGGYDFSRVLTLAAAIFISDRARVFIAQLRFSGQSQSMLHDLHTIQQTVKSPEERKKIALLESKMELAQGSGGKSRQDLLKDFAQLKKELEKIGRHLAFLAIDVADSTGMKSGEDPALVEHDFLAYQDFVETTLRENGMVRASWTPDGVMACFNSSEDAVRAAQEILRGLDHFNQEVKGIAKDFAVRCGINAGRVYYDESIPLEKFSDRVIDAAGHLQKYATPNTIWIAQEALEVVANRRGFGPAPRNVDGLDVCEWSKPPASDV
jgi:class 3 adenylate cyclase